MQLTSAEYTGPLSFMQFWIDVIANYEKSNQNESKIALSATKDVQDAILNDETRAKTVDVIDIRYWYYREDGTLYAPEGGKIWHRVNTPAKSKPEKKQTIRFIERFANTVKNIPKKQSYIRQWEHHDLAGRH